MSNIPRHLSDLDKAMDNALGSPIVQKDSGLSPEDGLVVEHEVSTSREELDQRLRRVAEFAAWTGAEGERNLSEAKEALLEAFPDAGVDVERAISLGRAFRDIEKQAIRYVNQGQKVPKKIFDRVYREFSQFSWRLKKSIKKAEKRRNRSGQDRVHGPGGKEKIFAKPRQNRTVKSSFFGKALVNRRGSMDIPSGLHASDVRSLEPVPRWTVLIDETGSEFGPNAAGAADGKKGKFVALVMPSEPIPLKPLPQDWHATECETIDEINQVFQAVLDADVGIFGVSMNCLPVTPGERWMDGVALLMDWVLRLLPVEGSTTIDVLVEQRGRFPHSMNWDLVARQVLRRLGIGYPNLASKIKLTVRTIKKKGSPFNGYVDAVAYTWAKTMKSSKVRLKQSQLLNNCLLEIDSTHLLELWDNFAQGVALPSEKWWEILQDCREPSFLIGNLLEVVGHEAKADVRLWERYLNECRRRMSSGPVDLGRLCTAVEWLQVYQPAKTAIPPLMELCLLTVRLARSNHMGASEIALESKILELSSRLVEESAPLVCYANLHLAVARTNRYEFDAATKSLEQWVDLPVAVPGLQYWGQVKSSFGQHSAFLGRNVEAVRLFEEAIGAFSRLSDPLMSDKEVAQTACYKAIAMMDDPAFTDHQVKNSVQSVIGSLPSIACELAADSSSSSRYAHHLLLRWLVNRGDESAKSAYLSVGCDWFVGDGHPWPLIQLYRGILVRSDNSGKALQFALDAADRAFSSEQGPVVRLIGACCRKIAVAWGEPWDFEEEELADLRISLPSAESQIRYLETWDGMNDSSLGLLRSVLPFNFR